MSKNSNGNSNGNSNSNTPDARTVHATLTARAAQAKEDAADLKAYGRAVRNTPKTKARETFTTVTLPSGATVQISDGLISKEAKSLAKSQFLTSDHAIATAKRKADREMRIQRALETVSVSCDARVMTAKVTGKYTQMLAEITFLAQNPDLQGLQTTLASLRKAPTAIETETETETDGPTSYETDGETVASIQNMAPQNDAS